MEADWPIADEWATAILQAAALEITCRSVPYHRCAEIMIDYVGPAEYIGTEGGRSHDTMHMPWADGRIWDFIGKVNEPKFRCSSFY